MKNLTQLLSITIPIIQAPMAGVQDSSLAIAVSNTGALGSLPCAMLSPENLYSELKKIKSCTDKPVNLNFFSHIMPENNEEQQKEWLKILQPYFDELGVDYHTAKAGASRLPFGQEHIEILKELKPSILSFHVGLPDKKLLEQVKEWGTKILSTATTVEEACWLESHGVDAIIAQGSEAGGHRGMFLTEDISTQTGTFALVPQIREAVSLPVIAAGGIADIKGIKAAKALGASGVQIGTSYLLCKETLTSPLHRKALRSENAKHTAITNIFTGRPARGIVNRVMKELGLINPYAPSFPYASLAMGMLRQASEGKSNSDFSPLWAGENTTGCRDISAVELTLKWAAEME